jgi:hypothetical protein
MPIQSRSPTLTGLMLPADFPVRECESADLHFRTRAASDARTEFSAAWMAVAYRTWMSLPRMSASASCCRSLVPHRVHRSGISKSRSCSTSLSRGWLRSRVSRMGCVGWPGRPTQSEFLSQRSNRRRACRRSQRATASRRTFPARRSPERSRSSSVLTNTGSGAISATCSPTAPSSRGRITPASASIHLLRVQPSGPVLDDWVTSAKGVAAQDSRGSVQWRRSLRC